MVTRAPARGSRVGHTEAHGQLPKVSRRLEALPPRAAHLRYATCSRHLPRVKKKFDNEGTEFKRRAKRLESPSGAGVDQMPQKKLCRHSQNSCSLF